jgi:hypothetical protein
MAAFLVEGGPVSMDVLVEFGGAPMAAQTARAMRAAASFKR